jgi:hypothetical protein
MVLNRGLLANYVGHDAEFEAQYLVLLKETVDQCLNELKQPSSQLYAVLHAAKSGIMVAVTAEVAALFTQACDLTVVAKNQALPDDVLKVLAMLCSQLELLAKEISAALKPQA